MVLIGERMETRTQNRFGGVVSVVIGRGLTQAKILFRLRLQNFVPGVSPQPLERVLTTVYRPIYIYIYIYIYQFSKKLIEKFFKYILHGKRFKKKIL